MLLNSAKTHLIRSGTGGKRTALLAYPTRLPRSTRAATIAMSSNNRQVSEACPPGDSKPCPQCKLEHKGTMDAYLGGDVVEIEEEEEDEEVLQAPGSPKGTSTMARATGAAAGAALAGAAVAMAGLPLATVGAGAAVVGAITGSLATAAIRKEWVRGENIDQAMEFDQAAPKGDQPGTHKEGAAGGGDTTAGDQQPHQHHHVFSVGRHHHQNSPTRPAAAAAETPAGGKGESTGAGQDKRL